MALVFLLQGVATPSEILGCEIIELLNELLFCHLQDSECSVVLQELKSISASPKPPELLLPARCVGLFEPSFTG